MISVALSSFVILNPNTLLWNMCFTTPLETHSPMHLKWAPFIDRSGTRYKLVIVSTTLDYFFPGSWDYSLPRVLGGYSGARTQRGGWSCARQRRTVLMSKRPAFRVMFCCLRNSPAELWGPNQAVSVAFVQVGGACVRHVLTFWVMICVERMICVQRMCGSMTSTDLC
jgi:hypothetical protein